MFGVDARNSGVNQTETGPASSDLQWTFETQSTPTSAAVADGMVYFGTDGGTIYAIDAADGSQEWSFEVDSNITIGPAVVDGTVFIPGSSGDLYALNAADGNEQWNFEFDSFEIAAPTVAHQTVYAANNKELVAIDATDGTSQWTFDIGNRNDISYPAVTEDTVYINGSDRTIYALSVGDGSLQWESTVVFGGNSSPAVVDGTVYIGSGRTVKALDTDTGEQQWEFQTTDDIQTSPAVVDGTVYVGSDDNEIFAIDSADGSEIWTFETGWENQSSPTVVDGTVYIGSGDNNVYALNAADGTQQWTYETGGEVETSPAVAGGTAYVGSSDNTVHALGDTNPLESEIKQTMAALLSVDIPTSNPIFGGVALFTSALAGAGIWRWKGEGLSNGKEDTTGVSETVPSTPKRDLVYADIEKKGLLGSGGNADVYAATAQTPTGCLSFALKEPRMSGTVSIEQVERLLDEAQTWASLDSHDHIVDLIDFGSDPLPWIAMEYMDGGHLGERAETLDYDQSVWTALAITRGVRHAHRQGVAHLDLKPQNILFRKVDDGWDVPKVADWGLSKHLLDHTHSRDGLSPHYAAPEQFDDERGPTNERTDIYQLGAVFYTLFTGQAPFEGGAANVMQQILTTDPVPPSKINSELPSTVDDILQTALAKDRSERYESIIYLRDVLESLYESE